MLSFISRHLNSTVAVLSVLIYLHGVGLWLFVRGFLLSRLSLSQISDCDPLESCTIPATHKRAIVLIIDALRFDFISPDVPNPSSPNHHHVLTLPAELTAKYPLNSFIFNAYADPPTTTLQRIKGITTGSLPTFVEFGSNFGGSEIEEDSIVRQLRIRSRKVAFMGDDTWSMVFPNSFEANMSHPFDSFNVEDLHTVDEGVIANLFPLLESNRSKEWDFLIGHFLGVDHVGHRLGPSHPMMKTKLTQMNDVLRRVVHLLDNETLIVLLGDHGMDLRGDHGGDSVHETSSALWIYSKSIPLSSPTAAFSPIIPWSLRSEFLFPGMSRPHRSIQQIDLVPTLSLLLGLPIPFNNLGTIIPELFLREIENPDQEGDLLDRAMRLNAMQVHSYLQAYRNSSSGAELDPYWAELLNSFDRGISMLQGSNPLAMYTRGVLGVCRRLWAQFDSLLMAFGLSVIAGSIVLALMLYDCTGRYTTEEWDSKTRRLLSLSILGGLVGVPLGAVCAMITNTHIIPLALWVSAMGVVVAPLFSSPSNFMSQPRVTLGVLILLLHTVSFFSNSFVFWEDRVVPFLLLSSIMPNVLVGIVAPTQRLRWRIVGFSLLSAVCVRLISISTVCREEQQPYCRVTFYASSSIAAPPLLILIAAVPTALLLPSIVRRFLNISKSDSGPAKVFLEYYLRLLLLTGTCCWLLEYAESISLFGEQLLSVWRIARSLVARFTIGGCVMLGVFNWWKSPLCLDIVHVPKLTPQSKQEVQIFGFANAYGSSYLLLVALVFSLVWTTLQLTGQVILALGLVALLSWLEVSDSIQDARKLKHSFESIFPSEVADFDPDSALTRPDYTNASFDDIVTLSLLGINLYYGTGHQSTLTSLQWKAAYLLTDTLKYPYSPVLVAINTAGPQLILALSAPLLALWNVAPLPHPAKSSEVERKALQTSIGFMIYNACLLLGSAGSAAWLRRHLMVWKVFAPRFMAGAVGLIAIDLGLVMGLLVGVAVVKVKVARTFGKQKGA